MKIEGVENRGDTLCTEVRPILCLRVDGSPRPPYDPPSNSAGVMNTEFYRGWANGRVGATVPITGTLLTSPEVADALCEEQLGPGYRMAEHHDGRWVRGMDSQTYFGDTWPELEKLRTGGWNFFSHGEVPSDTRYWARINDQPANCWNSAPADPSILTTSLISGSIGLERTEYNPGSVVSYEVQIINANNIAIEDVELKTYLPAGLLFAEDNEHQWHQGGRGNMTLSIGTLAAASEMTFNLRFEIDREVAANSEIETPPLTITGTRMESIILNAASGHAITVGAPTDIPTTDFMTSDIEIYLPIIAQ